MANQAVAQIRAHGGSATFAAVNLADDEAVAASAGAVAEEVSALHLLVNNAAILRQGRIEDGEWIPNWGIETRTGLLVLHSRGSLDRVAAFDELLHRERRHWFVREVLLYWKRTLKRLDLTARSVFTLVEPGSCFAGFLLELVLAADRSCMFEGEADDGSPAPDVQVGALNFGAFPAPNSLSRLEARFPGQPDAIDRCRDLIGRPLDATAAERAGLVTEVIEDLDWDDEVRIALEERASFSPDALTAMEANLRCPGPETMESRIFGRLSAWQNWIFQRPNAVGQEGALKLYGTGRRPRFDRERI